jgi:hypothetical protein
MRKSFKLCLGGAVLAVAGCAAPPPGPDATAAGVAIAPETRLVLPAPAELGRPVEAIQQVTARRDGTVYVFEVRLHAAADQVRLAGTDAAGRRAMTIDWTAGRLTVERAAWLPDTVRPEHVLGDLVIVFWPEGALRRALLQAEASLTADARGRVVRRDGKDLVSVRYDDNADPWSGVSRLHNLAWNYEIEIRSQRLVP